MEMNYSEIGYMMGDIRSKVVDGVLPHTDPDVKVSYQPGADMTEVITVDRGYEVHEIGISESLGIVNHNYDMDEQCVNDMIDIYCS